MPAPSRQDFLARPDRIVPVAVFAALPTLGLLSGPAYAGLMIGLGLLRLVRAGLGWTGLVPGGRLSWPEPRLIVLAALFLILCWASPLWSIVPATSLRGAAQETAILLPLLVLLSPWPEAGALAPRLFAVLGLAILAGAALVAADLLSGDHLQALVTGRRPIDAITKYNRGLDYLALIVWPVAGYLWRGGRRMLAPGLLALVLAMTLLGHSLAGKVAMAGGLLVLGAAALVPRVVAWAMRIGVPGLILTLPLTLRAMAERRAALVGLIKPSAINRLEIWDYMTARVAERPFLGWGLLSAHHVPISAHELARYHYVTAAGIYPHNQFLELWVELGALGALAGIALVLLVLARLPRLPSGLRPFALAAAAGALLVASVNYEITTDSWWAALAATALLFRFAAA